MASENAPSPSSRSSNGPWQPPALEEIQALFPQYEIVALLGRGGMGAVYKGWQRSLDRFVAIKILPQGLTDDPQYSERFKQEAKSMAKLAHAGIVAVFDAGELANGMLYFVMEFIEGTDVQKMIAEQGSLPPAHAMAITAHVCDALQYAHDRGIIHRDIKPANIMVGYDGVVKVADFGLAKQQQEGVSGLTQSGMVMGTLHYMAPESLILGVSVDHRADIYAVGIMLYQMLTGRLPQGLFEMPSQKVPGLDPRYDAVVAKAIREDRDIRYQSAAELRADLDSILTQPVVKVDPAATQAPAALPTVARPQRPQGYVQRAPQPVQKKSSATGILLVAVLILAAGALFVFKDKLLPQTSPSPSATAEAVKSKVDAPPAAAESGQKTSEAAATVSAPATAPRPAATVSHPAAVMTAPANSFTNSLGMKFVPVPETDILMCIHETRRQDYEKFAAETAGLEGFWKKQMCGSLPCGHEDDHPVVGVSWAESRQFCEWLSRKENRSYSLPKDEEWSRAVGVAHLESRPPGITLEMLSQKEQTQFPWEGTFPLQAGDRAGNYSDSTWHEQFPDRSYFENYTDGFATTSPVGSFKPNRLGLYDMGGNVWEWVEEWRNAEQKEHANRGASFFHNGGRGNLLSSSRSFAPANNRYFNTGFRVVVRGMVAAASAQPIATPPAPAAAVPKTDMKPAPPAQGFTNTLGMTFVPVPGTRIQMCVHETRRKDYAAFSKQAPAAGQENLPIEEVSWNEAKAFCDWLGKTENRIYRLPTDEEWSYAVGIGTSEIRSAGMTPEMLNQRETATLVWGGAFPPTTPGEAGNLADSAWHEKSPTVPWLEGYTDGFAAAAPVMSFKPNKLGIYDLDGNVAEWVEDWYNAEHKQRVMRGGSYGGTVTRLRALASNRLNPDPALRSKYYGFRCVLETLPTANTPPASTVQDSATTSLDAVFFATTGQVSVIGKDGQTSPGGVASPAGAVVAAVITPGCIVKTGPASSADLALSGGGSIRLEADSELKLSEAPVGKTGFDSLELVKGRLFLNISSMDLARTERTELRFKTPAAVVAVQGAKCFAEIGAAYETVGVFTGSVEITEIKLGAKTVVKDDMAASVKAGAISPTRRLAMAQTALRKICDQIELVRTEVEMTSLDDDYEPTFADTYRYANSNEGKALKEFSSLEPTTSSKTKVNGHLVFAKFNDPPNCRIRVVAYTPRVVVPRTPGAIVAVESAFRSDGIFSVHASVQGHDPTKGLVEIIPAAGTAATQRMVLKAGDGSLEAWRRKIYPLFDRVMTPVVKYIRPRFSIYFKSTDAYYLGVVPGRKEYRLEVGPMVIISRKPQP